jgi:hypothetical protein
LALREQIDVARDREARADVNLIVDQHLFDEIRRHVDDLNAARVNPIGLCQYRKKPQRGRAGRRTEALSAHCGD